MSRRSQRPIPPPGFSPPRWRSPRESAGGSRRRWLLHRARRRRRSARSRPLRGGIDSVERLACGHEQPVALGSAEGDVAAHLGEANPPEQLAFRRPACRAVVADGAAGIAGGPDIAVDVAAYAVRSAFHAVDREVAEQLLVRQLVVGADIEYLDVALAARTGIARPFAGADHIELLVIGREAQAVRIRHLVLAHHEVDAAGGIDAVAIGRQFALA